MIGKYILPWFGGTAGVWTTCLLFFQTTLLVGYAYAHGSVSRLNLRGQTRLHRNLLLISLAILVAAACFWPTPITPGPSWKPQSGEIAVWLILRLLFVSVGAVVLLLASTGPLMQHWFTRVCPGVAPYRLYALSNAGSLLGLLSYPAVLEPILRLHVQAWVWSAGYVIYAAAAISCAALAARSSLAPARKAEAENEADVATLPPSKKTKALWFSLAALGSLMLLAITRFITEDLAPIPLLWVLPLAAYLISFVICFDHPRWYRPGLFHPLLLATAVMTIMIYGGLGLPLRVFIAAFLLTLLACCMFCHGELYRRRPQPQHLTSFYLMIALGGVAGSTFVNLLAPIFFRGYWELHLGMALCLIMMAAMAIGDKQSWAHRKNLFVPLALAAWVAVTALFWLRNKSGSLPHFFLDWHFCALAIIVVVCTLLAFSNWKVGAQTFALLVPVVTRYSLLAAVAAASCVLVWAGTARYRSSSWAHRNFYGALYIVKKTTPVPHFDSWVLMHGNTYHGIQLIDPGLRNAPTGYYNQTSGVGLTLLNYPRQHDAAGIPQGLRVGDIGLGAGTIAAYGLHGDVFRFYEIDPEIVRVAGGQYGYFSFLSNSRARIEVIEGDGRISLERELASGQPQNYDVFVVDAFNGDAVPSHLLTREAFELYLKHLRDENSVIAVHVSNRAVELASVVAAEAEYFHLHVAFINAPGFSSATVPAGIISPNQWILLSRGPNVLSLPAIAQATSPMHPSRGLHFWTDEQNDLLQILR